MTGEEGDKGNNRHDGDRLFRSEALQAQQQQCLGELRLITPLRARLLVSLSVIVALALLVFLLLGHYTRRERVAGILVPSTGLITVSSVSSGVLRELLVREGQAVRKGQTLGVVSTERASTQGETAAMVLVQLRSQQERTEADLRVLDALATQQRRGFDQRIRLLQRERAQIVSQRGLARQQADNAAHLLKKITSLGHKGYVSAYEVSKQRTASLDARAQIKVLNRQLLSVQQQEAILMDQRAQLPLTLSRQRHDLERQRADLLQSMAETEAQRGVVLHAPRDGVVSAVLVARGQRLIPGQTVLSLVPHGSRLQAQLLVPSQAVGFVKPGERVAVRYAAFPYQKFGLQGGTVAQVSRSALTPAEVSALLGTQAPAELMYRVRVALDSENIATYGQQQALKPGMQLEADLLLERRRLVELMFESLYGFSRQVPVPVHGS